MVNIFEKRYFKKYLHKNCHRWWFSKNSTNAMYKNSDGVHNVDAYGDEYTVRVKEILEDPCLADGNRAMRVVEGVSVGAAVTIPLLLAATAVTGPFAPIFATADAVFSAAAAGAFGATGAAANNMKNEPFDVYFHITGDDSYWKAEKVPCGGIRDIAYKICRWSNEVYRERYIQRRSDDYEFQAQIEQRSPTPY